VTTITFDTLKYAKRLKEAGFTESQAEAQTQALAEALKDSGHDLATKADLRELEIKLKAEIAVLDARLRMIERVLWGIVLGVIALLIRAYVLP